MKKVTLDDIAKACGVTKGAVSRALADKYNVGAETTYLIKQTALEMGYDFKKLKISKTTNKRALILCPSRLFFKENFWISIIKSLTDRLSQNGLNAEYFIFDDENIRESLENQKNFNYCCFIIIHYNTKELMNELTRKSIPIVVIDPKFDCIGAMSFKFSNFDSSYQATQTFINKGHKRIAFYGSNEHSSSFKERYNGYISCISCYPDVEHREIIFDNSNKCYADNTRFREMLKEFKPTAVMCANDLIALNAYKVIKTLGLKIPSDVSVIGFDNIADSLTAKPKLSTFDIPLKQIGVVAAEYVINLIKKDDITFSEIVVRCDYIERESVK